MWYITARIRGEGRMMNIPLPSRFTPPPAYMLLSSLEWFDENSKYKRERTHTCYVYPSLLFFRIFLCLLLLTVLSFSGDVLWMLSFQWVSLSPTCSSWKSPEIEYKFHLTNVLSLGIPQLWWAMAIYYWKCEPKMKRNKKIVFQILLYINK